MKKNSTVLIFLFLIFITNTHSQYLHGITRADSTMRSFEFQQTIFNSENYIVDLSMNNKPGYEAPLLLTETDTTGVILKSKKFKFFSDSLNFICNGTPATSGTEFARTKCFFSPFDTSYYFAGVLVARYGICSPPFRTTAFLKLDKNLDTLWFREYAYACHNGINLSSDTGLICSALSIIRKLNPANGDSIWTRGYLPSNGNSYGILGQNRAYSDSEFIVCGGTNLFAHPTRRGMLTKFNQAADILWAKAYGDNIPEYFHSVNPTNDSSYIIVNEHDYGNNADASVVKISKDGTFLWGKYYDKPGKKVLGYDIVNTPDNNYFLTLSVLDTFTFVQNAFLLKLDTVGNIIWCHKLIPPVSLYPYQEVLKNFMPAPDGGYYINGTHLIKIDSTGYGCWFINDSNAVVQHDLFFVTDTMPLISQVIPPAPFGDYMHVNDIFPVSFTDSMWVDSCLNTTGIQEQNNYADDLIIYPNPASNYVSISSPHLANKEVTVTIYDVMGKQKLQNKYAVSADGKIEMDVSGLQNGIYFIRIGNGVKKFIKM